MQNNCNEAQSFSSCLIPQFVGESGVEVATLMFTFQNTADLYCSEASGLSLNRKRIGVIFPSVSVQEIICTGILMHKILSMSINSLAVGM